MRARGYQRAFERGGTLRAQARWRSLVGSVIVTLLWIFGSVSVVQAEPCSGTQGNLVVSPTSLDFGEVSIGNSKSLTLTVANTGCASLSISTLTNFSNSVFNLQNTTCSTVLTAGGSCTINFSFTPTVVATVTNSYTLSTSINSVTVPFRGVGKAAFTTGCDVTTIVGTGGNISPAGVTHLSCGTSGTFAITPNTGYRINNILLDGSSVGAVNSYALSCSCNSSSSQYCTSGGVNVNNMSCVNGSCTGVKITCGSSGCSACDGSGCRNILYNGTTSISGGSINCSNGQCSYSVKNGGSSSSGNFSCGNSSTTTVLKKQTLEARFEVLANPTLNVSVSGNGNISGNGINCGTDCSESYTFNTPVTLTATPASGFVFGSWSGACSGTSPSTTITMDAAKTCTANFVSSAAACPSASNPLKVKVWVDKNGNKSYNVGEEVSGALVSMNNSSSSGLTNASGIIQISQASPTDKIYAEKAFYSFDNVKAVDSNFGGTAYNPYAVSGVDRKAYTFVMASDVMRKLDGYYFDFPSTGPLCGSGSTPLPKDSQGNILIQLVHPKIEWNLVVAFEQAQSASFYDQVRTGFRSYADFMYNYTDGHFLVKNVVFVNGKYAGSPQWNYSDVQVKNSEWPNAHVFGNRYNGYYHIHMGKTWEGHGPTGYNWYSTLGHESGHYLLGFGDEYTNGNYTKGGQFGYWQYRETRNGDWGEPNEFPKNYGVMESQYNGVHELSDTTDYFPRSKPYNVDQVTAQYYQYGMSTWDFLRTFYQKEMQSKLGSQGFSPAFFANLILPPHLTGSYPYSDSAKRAGPAKMNHDSITFRKADREEARAEVNFIEWTAPSNTRTGDRESLFDATVQVVDGSGMPIPQAEVWLVSAEGIKHLQGKTNRAGEVVSNSVSLGKRLEAYFEGRKTELTIAEKADHYLLAIPSSGLRDGERSDNGLIVKARLDDTQPSKLIVDVLGDILTAQPSVTLSQPESYVASVPMDAQADNSYAGLVESQYSSGTLEVVSGDSQSISAFERFSTEVPLASGFPAPNGELLMTATSESFVGSGAFIITTSTAPAPANDNLVQVGNVWSFAFANSISAVRQVGLEILLSAEKMKGLDATQLNLYGWDNANKHWQLIAGGGTRDLKSFNITLDSLDYMSYALFAPVSEDTVAPNAITGLQSNTGDSRWRINLQWTPSSDDKGVYVYEIRFNTVPVTEANWNDSFAIRTVPTDTTFVMEMPDPNKNYYFAIRAADAASNWSPIAILDTPTKSQSSDTDEDGMLDAWETKYFGDLSHDGMADTDSDLFTDLEEFEAGTDPMVPNIVSTYSVSGAILDAQNNPVEGVIVQIEDKVATTNAIGYWEMSGFLMGNYQVIATKDGYAIASQNVTVKDGNVTIDLTAVRAYTVFGTVVDKSGKPIANADITVEVGGKTTKSDATGYWEISGLLEGTYGVEATGNHYSCNSSDVKLSGEQYRQLVEQPVICEPATTLKLTAKASASGILRIGQEVTYTFTVVNGGQQTATGVVLSEQLPKNVELISMVASNDGVCDVNTMKCTLPDLAPGAKATVTLTLKATKAGSLNNVATLTSSEYPAAVQTTWREVNPYLSVVIKDSPDPVPMKGELHYQVVVALDSQATQPAEQVKLTLQLPEGTVLKSIIADSGTCDSSKSPTITCDLNDLGIGTSTTVNVDVTLIDGGLLVLTHEAKVTASHYPTDTHKERTSIYLGDNNDVKVDVILAVDITNSMQQEINGVKKAIEDLLKTIDPSTAPTVALVTFKDDVRVDAYTGDLKVLLKAVKSLKVDGGGTCPEASAEALELAIKYVKEGGTILLATDAPPYNDADLDKLAELIKSKNIKLQTIVTEGCSGTEETQ